MASLRSGDLVLVGPGLPHVWQSETVSGHARRVHALLMQFNQRLLSEALLTIPAFQPVRQLLHRARRGLHVVGRTRQRVDAMMKELADLKGLARFLAFLNILDVLAASEECHPIASAGFADTAQTHDPERMDRVLQFLQNRLGEDIRLSDVARISGLSEGAFSRFFRIHTGKTFPEFMNELRIGRVCRLLMESEKTITESATEAGFKDISNFNGQFRRFKNCSPSEFRQRMHNLLTNGYGHHPPAPMR